MSFDYGNKLSDGQFERHPSNKEGGFIAPLRKVYIHKTCGETTSCPDNVVETYAKHPNFYTRTFCVSCREYFPISEFNWKEDGVQLGKIKNDEVYKFFVDENKFLTEHPTVSVAFIRSVANIPHDYTICLTNTNGPSLFFDNELTQIELVDGEKNFHSIPPATMG